MNFSGIINPFFNGLTDNACKYFMSSVVFFFFFFFQVPQGQDKIRAMSKISTRINFVKLLNKVYLLHK